MVRKQTNKKSPEMVDIEVGYLLPYPAVGAPGEARFTRKYEYRRFGVPKAVEDICRLLDARRDYGVHLAKIGGVDTLAELEMWNINYRMSHNAKRGTGYKECWVKPDDIVFRFAEDFEVAKRV